MFFTLSSRKLIEYYLIIKYLVLTIVNCDKAEQYNTKIIKCNIKG